jgi:regulator of replication initiation timing
MKKIIILALFLISCSKKVENQAIKTETEVFLDSSDIVSKVEKTLEKTIDLDKKIETKVERVKVLQSENKTLKKELKETKDSLVLAKEELVKSKVKVPKKKSFFQKVLGSKPDSLEVEKIDTIKVQ